MAPTMYMSERRVGHPKSFTMHAGVADPPVSQTVQAV